MHDIFKRISEQWFLREPAFFSLYCTHPLEENFAMQCVVRSGQHRIEYNPALMRGLTTADIERLLRIELLRLFMKHPYQRQPEGCSLTAKRLGSDCALSSYGLPVARGEEDKVFAFAHPSDFQLDEGMHFEWYARRIEEQLEQGAGEDDKTESPSETTQDEMPTSSSDSPGEGAWRDSSVLWREDALAVQDINDLIKTLTHWGSIPGDVVQMIQASTQSRIDYRLIMQGFRGHILSSKRRLTRMRPNRRTGFDQMGSVRKFDTRLLVAVDVSGSISDRTLTYFYGVINRFFRYGIDQIDCVQFDSALGEVRPLRKASRRVEVKGRGGTNFQPIFDYVLDHNDYDGLLILTDGGAPHPVVDPSLRAKVLWICEDEHSYQLCRDWMSLFGRVCYMVL